MAHSGVKRGKNGPFWCQKKEEWPILGSEEGIWPILGSEEGIWTISGHKGKHMDHIWA